MSRADAKVAIVTGAGHGLGTIIANRLHAEGYRVLLTDIDLDAAGKVAAALDAAGETANSLCLDISRKEDFERALTTAIAIWGRVHVLVNNAAVTQAVPVMEISPEAFIRVLSTNAGGVFFGCQVFGEHFRKQRYGRIVNLASLAGQNGGTATGAHYAASKGAILTLTKVFARELAADGVTVNAISPGPLDLPIVRSIVPAERFDAFLKSIPVGTLGDPDFLADMVAQLVSPQAAFVTGATWDVNGGLYVR
jgi:3-oxoacyl-[acyl-carrier protein] reductase